MSYKERVYIYAAAYRLQLFIIPIIATGEVWKRKSFSRRTHIFPILFRKLLYL